MIIGLLPASRNWLQMTVDDLVAQHIDPRLPPKEWRLTLPWSGSGGPHQYLTERQLDEVCVSMKWTV